MSFFTEVAFPWVVGIEKGYQNDPEDPGNWTGGEVGSGLLLGTKYGVSAKSYPHLDIPNVTLEEAQKLAKVDFWDKFRGDQMPGPVSLSVFDFGYNSGIHEGVVVLQRTLDLPEDGIVGPITLRSLSTRDPKWVVRTYYIERMGAYMKMKGWIHDGHGWSARALATRDKALSL